MMTPRARKHPKGVAGPLPEAARLSAWMIEKSLPFWSSRTGICRMPVVEATRLDGSAFDPGFLRLRVMARQVAVLCCASQLGITGIRPVADHAWEALLSRFYSPVSGWASRIGTFGQVIDREFSLYDQAFGLYACACRARLTGDRQPIALAHRTSRHIQELLGSSHGLLGWRTSKGATTRDQNSHMHFLEALLALYEVMPSLQTAARIEEILETLSRHLFDQATGTISEWFDITWKPVEPRRVEPGHQFEWYWLITKAKQAGFKTDVPAERLFDFAQSVGTSATHGLLFNACHPDGTVVDSNYRLWPHCEAIRAASVHPDKQLAQRLIEQSSRNLLEHFLGPAATGTWHDRLDADLTPISDHVPASSLYHLWEAVAALHTANLVLISRGEPCS